MDNGQKQQIYTIINNEKIMTDKQKERFILLYNLRPDEKKYNLTDIARKFNVKPTAIKSSIMGAKQRLFYISDKDMIVIKDIIEKVISKIK